MRTPPALEVVSAVLLLAACEGKEPADDGRRGEGEACTFDTDCFSSGICLDGICRRPCAGDSACDEITQHCQAGVCMPGSALDCGNGRLQPFETCDDGDKDNGDGCSSFCTVEIGWSCAGQPSACVSQCGDGLVVGSEACDDGATTTGDGCDATCVVETGWDCSGTPSTCSPVCGDGVLIGGEGCDDGDTTAADGCGATCVVENGWLCTGEPSACNCAAGTQDHDHDGLCQPSCATADLSQCSDRGICDDTSGVAFCDCDANRAGRICELCVVYVSLASVTEDGEQWETAFHGVQAAVDSAEQKGSACEVWIAAGTYVIGSAVRLVEDRARAALYGGFAGNERTREARSSDASLTVLDGQQVPDHVIIAYPAYPITVGEVLLDGMTLTRGNANGSVGSRYSRGGGVYLEEVSAQIRNCRIAGNESDDGGGGIFATASSLRLEDAVIDGNDNDGGDGGGGLLIVDPAGENTVLKTVFTGNAAAVGGAIRAVGRWDLGDTITIERSTFINNRARSTNGGAIALGHLGPGGGDPTVINSVFVGNISDDAGGAIYAEDDVDVAGSTFVDNSATQNGTAIYVNDRGALVGNILWGKVGSLTLAQRGQGGNAPLTYSDVEGGYPGTGNIDADPAFVSAGDFHLQQGSPCIDAGSDSAGPTLDFDGITRVCLDVSGNVAWDGCPDMGAYEYVP